MHKLKIVIADDNAAFLHQMNALLGAEFDVAATAEDGRMALAKALQHRPDVVVLDLAMPFLNGMKIARELTWMVGNESPLQALRPSAGECNGPLLLQPSDVVLQTGQAVGVFGIPINLHSRDAFKTVLRHGN